MPYFSLNIKPKGCSEHPSLSLSHSLSFSNETLIFKQYVCPAIIILSKLSVSIAFIVLGQDFNPNKNG